MNSNHSGIIFTNKEQISLLVLVIIAFVLGVLGYYEYYKSIDQSATLFDLMYRSLTMFFLDFPAEGKLPWTLEMARWLAPLTLTFTIVKTFLALARSKFHLYQLSRKHDHAILFGLDKNSAKLACSMLKNGQNPVVVEDDEHNQYLGILAESKVPYLIANPADKTLLKKLNLAQAKYLFANTASDSTNLEILHQALSIEKTRLLKAVCKIRQISLINVLSSCSLFSTNHPNMETKLINHKKLTARWLLGHQGPDILIKDFASRQNLHIGILGDNLLLNSLVERLAEIGIYCPNSQLKVSIIHVGKVPEENLLEQSSVLNELLDINHIHLPDFNLESLQTNAKITKFDCLYVLLKEFDSVLLSLHYLQRCSVDFPVVVTETDNLQGFTWLSEEFYNQTNFIFANPYDAIHDFDSIFGEKQDALAKAIHNAYLAEEEAKGLSVQDNNALVPWDELPEVLKDANRNQADHSLTKCRFLTGTSSPDKQTLMQTLSKENVELLAEMEHQRWVAEKRLAGWQYTSGEKDSNRRLSPSLIPYNELSEAEKQKDRDTILNLPKLLELRGKAPASSAGCRRLAAG
ncbi:RyR domain-containing protein [Glaciecola sp. 1036]|uniref:RyR domain-containing protein n=1 Tax=Alteromonadaceae TaxID=72275 RepID=UPI003D02688B